MEPTTPGKIDLQAEWNRACTRFLQTTGQDPMRRPVPTPDDVIRMVMATAARDAKKNQKLDRLRDIAGKTLDCVMKLGAVAANAASMVFGPSSMCMNAISIFVDAGKAYGNIFSSLDTLFSRIFEALQRFQHYLKSPDDVPEEMKQISHEILLKFMSICELSWKVLHKFRLIQILKTLAFNDDAGVSKELEELERLEVKESRMGIAVVVTTTKATQREVAAGFAKQAEEIRGLGETLRQSKNESNNRENLEIIKRQLGISATTFDDDYRRIQNSFLPDTGDWTMDEPDIAAWANAQSKDVPALFLAAEPGYGKTFVFTRILRDLQKRYKQGLEAPDRVSVAYLYLNREARASNSSDTKDQSTSSSTNRGPTVDVILRTWALQIAQNDPVYRKDLLSSYATSPGLSDDLQQLKFRLFADHASSKATFFLLVDAVDLLANVDEAESTDQMALLQQILSDLLSLASPTLNVKVLLTGERKSAELLTEKLSGQVTVIDIASKTQKDIEKYVVSRIEKMDVFKNSEAFALKEELRIGLIDKLEGNFGYADYLLKRIAREQRPSEIRNILKTAEVGKKSSDAIGDDIRKCNEELDPVGDIPDLNVLLLWVIYAFRQLTVNQLKSVLRAHGREVVLTFFNQIRERFNLFFVISTAKDDPDAVVELASDDIAEFLQKEAEAQSIAVAAKKENITEGEIRLVKNFLRTFCEDTLYQKLGFDDFFREKMSKGDAVIKIPESNHAHAEIALRCLMAVNGEFGDDVQEIIDYSYWNIERHLKGAGDLSLLDPALKSSVGSQLYAFLTGPTAAQNYHKGDLWMWYDDVFYDEISRFLQDGAVLRNLTVKQKEWIKSRINGEGPDNSNLLEEMAKHVARIWLGDKEATNYPFVALIGYINKTEHDANASVHRLNNLTFLNDGLPADAIYNIAAWAFEYLDAETAKTQGKIALGNTFRDWEKYDEALKAYGEAKVAMDGNLLVDTEIAFTWARKKDFKQAISILLPVIDACERGVKVFDAEDQSDEVKKHLLALAQWYGQAEMLDEANAICQKLLSNDLSNYEHVAYAFTLYIKQKRFEDVMSIIKRMEDERDHTDSERSRLAAMMDELRYDNYPTLFEAAKGTGELPYLGEQYTKVIDFYRERHKKEQGDGESLRCFVVIKTFYALTAYRFFDTAEAKKEVEAHMLEIVLFKATKSVPRGALGVLRYMQKLSLQKLLEVYGERTLAAGVDSEQGKALTEHVKDLAKHVFEGDHEELYGFDAEEVRSSFGRYYNRVNLLDDAREQLRANMSVGIMLLSDDDPTNDWQGYRKLGDALMDYGDLKNAIASWTMIRPTEGLNAEDSDDEDVDSKDVKAEADTEDNNSGKDEATADTSIPVAPPSPSPSDPLAETDNDPAPPPRPLMRSFTSTMGLTRGAGNSHKLSGPLTYSCDGGCDTKWTFSDNFQICRDCIDKQFCPGCFAKLKAGELDPDLCSGQHRFMYIPPFDRASADRLGLDNILVQGKVMSVEEWLEGLKREWGLDQGDNEVKKSESQVETVAENATATPVLVAAA